MISRTPYKEKVLELQEKWIADVSKDISSVDSHMINAIGPGGTVAAQIIRNALPTLLQQQEKEIKEEGCYLNSYELEAIRDLYRKELFEEVIGIAESMAKTRQDVSEQGYYWYNYALSDLIAKLKEI